MPGGVANPDTLRTETKAVDFVKAFLDAEKPVAGICHCSLKRSSDLAAAAGAPTR